MPKYKRDKVKLRKRAAALSTDIMGSYVANIRGWGVATLLQDALELAERRGYKQGERDTRQDTEEWIRGCGPIV